MSESEPEQDQSKIVQLLLRMQEDFKLLAEFDKDPDMAMVEAGISSKADRDILKTRDMLKIHQLLERKKPSDGKNEQQEKT